jgi:phosphoglycolate phosphatase
VKAVLFDFDGTLAEMNINFPTMYQGVHDRMRHWGVDPGALHRTYILEQILEATERLGPSGEIFRQEAEEVLRRVEIEAARRGRLLPGVRRFLRALKRAGIRVGVLTRNCRDAVLEVASDLEDSCDAFVPRDGLHRVKPHPEQALRCLAVLKASQTESMMVGDHVIDIHAGAALGMRTVGVLTGKTPREALEQAGADLVLKHVTCLGPLMGLAADV